MPRSVIPVVGLVVALVVLSASLADSVRLQAAGHWAPALWPQLVAALAAVATVLWALALVRERGRP